MRRWIRYLAPVLVLGGLLTALRSPSVERWLGEFVIGGSGLTFTSMLVFGATYVVATVLLVPGTILGLASGFLYGPVVGVLIVSPASVLGATLAFLVGRYLLRHRVESAAADNPKFASIDRAIASQGWKVVFLLRLSPLIPFNLINYGLGVTRVRLRDYVTASFLGMLPGTAMIVYLGSLIATVDDLVSGQRPDGGWPGVAMTVAGVVATVAVVWVVGKLGRNALSAILVESEPDHDPAS